MGKAKRSKAWFMCRTSKLIWNTKLRSSITIINDSHAMELYWNQSEKGYRYSDESPYKL